MWKRNQKSLPAQSWCIIKNTCPFQSRLLQNGLGEAAAIGSVSAVGLRVFLGSVSVRCGVVFVVLARRLRSVRFRSASVSVSVLRFVLLKQP